MDVLVEEDENIVSPLSGTRDEADLLVTEQAIKLFRLCDKKGKGFVVKEDLVQMRELVPGMSSSAIESFFDNIVVSKSNFLTEGQFVDGIKPILLKSERDANNKDVRSTGSLSGSVSLFFSSE
ncbi:hypothetical protein Tcan_10544 [Toxocara canis]|uniref:EF-hand domain-containing protein n=1 Tax=Toxocara canis TaxID=6265 RepID=A0A0B2V2Z5_TOXCA|nr:hypothetical protein Tcan_10544 [Toxocara canis]